MNSSDTTCRRRLRDPKSLSCFSRDTFTIFLSISISTLEASTDCFHFWAKTLNQFSSKLDTPQPHIEWWLNFRSSAKSRVLRISSKTQRALSWERNTNSTQTRAFGGRWCGLSGTSRSTLTIWKNPRSCFHHGGQWNYLTTHSWSGSPKAHTGWHRSSPFQSPSGSWHSHSAHSTSVFCLGFVDLFSGLSLNMPFTGSCFTVKDTGFQTTNTRSPAILSWTASITLTLRTGAEPFSHGPCSTVSCTHSWSFQCRKLFQNITLTHSFQGS